MARQMEWPITVGVAIIGLALLPLAIWQGSRPRKDDGRTRWIPWRFVIFLSGAVILLALVHAANLLGFHTGGGGQRLP
jgi:hypothetical protein